MTTVDRHNSYPMTCLHNSFQFHSQSCRDQTRRNDKPALCDYGIQRLKGRKLSLTVVLQPPKLEHGYPACYVIIVLVFHTSIENYGDIKYICIEIVPAEILTHFDYHKYLYFSVSITYYELSFYFMTKHAVSSKGTLNIRCFCTPVTYPPESQQKTLIT